MNILQEIPFKTPIKEIVLERGIFSKAAQIMESWGKTHLVCDENTQHFVKKDTKTTVFTGNCKALLSSAQTLASEQCDTFVAVGSGTIGDIVKYAAFLAGKPYIIFGTAPSMNGYASGNASLLDGGYKKTFAAKPPAAIYLDLEVLENVPRRLINAGIGDSVCRPTIEADLLLSKQILGTPDYAEYLSLIKKYENEIFDSVEALTKTLIFSGVAMLLSGSSAPASQGEHMIAHAVELYFPDAPHSYHGEQIAVTTLTMLDIIESSLRAGEPLAPTKAGGSNPAWIAASASPPRNDELEKHFGEYHAKYFAEQYRTKTAKLPPVIPAQAGILNEDIRLRGYDTLRDSLEKNLQKIHCPTKPEQIGWDTQKYNELLPLVKFTRDRFTFLDLL